jgi:hypothetical protein
MFLGLKRKFLTKFRLRTPPQRGWGGSWWCQRRRENINVKSSYVSRYETLLGGTNIITTNYSSFVTKPSHAILTTTNMPSAYPSSSAMICSPQYTQQHCHLQLAQRTMHSKQASQDTYCPVFGSWLDRNPIPTFLPFNRINLESFSSTYKYSQSFHKTDNFGYICDTHIGFK